MLQEGTADASPRIVAGRPYASNEFFGWSPQQEVASRVQPDELSSREGLADDGLAATLRGGAADGCELQLMTLGLKQAGNIGGLLRLSGCFGVRSVHHVGAWGWRQGGSKHCESAADKGTAPGLIATMGEAERRTMLSVAKGCEHLVAHLTWTLKQLLGFLDDDAGRADGGDESAGHHADDGGGSDGGASPCTGRRLPSRLPLVVMETAPGAVPVHDFRFPSRCVLVVGAEAGGIDRRLVQRLVPGFDALVYVPMPGAHKSLNVVEAACCGLYEYRRQWPGEAEGAGHGSGDGSAE